MHDSCVVVSLLKAIPIVLTAKILVISEVAKGLAPWASVWCGGEWANAYPLIPLTGGLYFCNLQPKRGHREIPTNAALKDLEGR